MKTILLPLRNSCVLALIVFICLISCSSDKKKYNNHSSSLIKNFTIFRFGHPDNDTITRCFLKSIYFKDDSVVIVSTRDDYSYEYSKTQLTEEKSKILNRYLRLLSVDSLLGSELISRVQGTSINYCGNDFGFVSLNDSIGIFNTVFFSESRKQALDSIQDVIFNLKGSLTNDSIEVVKAVGRIQAEYLKIYPPIPQSGQTVKFAQPIKQY